jgi:hypothetical protein
MQLHKVELCANVFASTSVDAVCFAYPYTMKKIFIANILSHRSDSVGGVSLLRSDPMLPCIGLAIVRGVDAASNALYLLTSVPSWQLEQVCLLTVGRISLPSLFHFEPHLAATVKFPYLSIDNLPASGGAALRSRHLARRRLTGGAARID